ncbi:MAG: LysM peptidoglycan-binding domain-containing protein [Clostridium sp.]|nr:LysM peptidoglycan-binding domain-containing protein [Clostridium sp.]
MLYKIASKFNTTVAAIVSLNPGINTESLRIGQVICIPLTKIQDPICPIGTSPYEIKTRDTIAGIANRFNTTIEAILLVNPGIVPKNLRIGQVICISQEKTQQTVCPMFNSYVIRKGETFGSIAKLFNLSLLSLLNANPTVVPENLYEGLVICVPVAPSIYSIAINTITKNLTLYRNKKLFKVYPVAVGKPTTPTPMGTFTVVNKQLNPGGPFGSRWMGLSKPHYGIHGTNNPASIGTAASNGCVRMYASDVEDLFNYVNVGTVVEIF